MPAARRSRPAGLSIRACAKINLMLRVMGRRPDGYHDLRTVLQSLALHDTLTFRSTRGPFVIDCDDPACPIDRTNLVWQAAAHVWRAGGRRGEPEGVHVTLEKRIPIQAGLGGGSSDAAAAIRGLSRFWRIDLSAEAAYAIAAGLGADVPYFLHGGTALGLDRGDRLFPLVDLPASSVVLAVPPFGVSTRDAYAWWDESLSTVTPPVSRVRRHSSPPDPDVIPHWLARELGNDLERPVTSHHPEIGRLVRAFRESQSSYAAMSGSGSAVFALCPSTIRARQAARAVSGGWRTVTRFVSGALYRRFCEAT